MSLLLPLSPYFLALVVATVQIAVSTLGLSEITISRGWFPEEKRTPFVYGSIMLMIAFLLSMMIMAFGGRFLGWDLFRVKVGISFGFFLFCFLTIVVYYNLRQRLNVKDGLG